jgi:hypothetical protein
MAIFKKLNFKQGYVFYFVLIIINFPKINLVSIAGYKQGIRLDDLLILLFCLFNFRHISFSKTNFYVFFYITLTYLFSFIHQPESIFTNFVHFHYLRFLEYLFLYLILVKKLDCGSIFNLAITTLIFQFVFSLITFLFFFNPAPTFTRLSRASGTTAGPWELTMMLGTLYFVISDYYKHSRARLKDFFVYLSFWILIIIAYSRIVAIAFLSIFIIQRAKIFFIFFMIFIFIFIIFGNTIVSFSLEIPDKLNLSYFKLDKAFNFLRDFGSAIIENWSKGNFYLGNRGNFYDETSRYYDPSLVGRLQQWGRYLNVINNSDFKSFAILFGSGPGSGGIINDGMYIKIFVDFGLFGLLIYFFLVINLFIKKKEVRFLLIFISICCITLDFYWPTKIAYSLILVMCYFDKKNYKQGI